MSRQQIIVYRWLNALALLLTLGVNALASLLPLGGVETGDISKKYFNLFTPAPLTFAIWGVIYLLLVGFVLFQAGTFPKQREESEDLVQRIGPWFLFSCLFNSGWLFCWHYDWIGLSTALMLGLLVSLAVLYRKTSVPGLSPLYRFLGQAPFRLYFGWITVATIANITVWLVKIQWNAWGLSQSTWMIVILIVGALIALVTTLKNRDWVYAAAVFWAYIGILIRQLSPQELNGAYPGVIITTIVCGVLLAAAGIWSAVRVEKG